MAESAAQIQANARAFEKMVGLVQRRASAGRHDSAAAWGRIAAAFAMTNPCGLLRDADLELALDEVSRAALPAPTGWRPETDGSRRVLHVLSEGHMIGGDIRMVLRWVRSDEESVPSAVVTRPLSESRELAELVRARGGSATVLESHSLIDRARRLRSAAEAADIVICHTHADDPIPTLAFGGDYSGAPIALINHADHVFGLGVGNVSVIVSQREIAAEAAVRARGYPEESQLVSPIPLPGVARGLDRAEAKRRLGIDGAQVLALTLARPAKYPPAPWHPGFVEVLRPALEADPRLTLAAVGPDDADPAWRSLAEAAPGRVVVPGPQDDPSDYLDAADVYLDSFPFASITSMLEAAARDVPILTSRMYPGMLGLMSSAGPLDDAVVGAADVPAYRAELSRLTADPEHRARVGAAGGAAVRRRHGGEAWAALRERIYERALDARPVEARLIPSADPGELAAYSEALLGIEARTPLLWTIGYYRDGFDAADRCSSLIRTLAVRVAQKATGAGAGAGPRASSYLIPSGSLA